MKIVLRPPVIFHANPCPSLNHSHGHYMSAYECLTYASHMPHVCLATEVRRAFEGCAASGRQISAKWYKTPLGTHVESIYTWLTDPQVSTNSPFLPSTSYVGLICDSVKASLGFIIFAPGLRIARALTTIYTTKSFFHCKMQNRPQSFDIKDK